MNLIGLIIAIATATVFIANRRITVDLSDVFRKAIASFGFIFLAIIGLRMKSDGVSAFVVAGLVCGLLGDVFLDLKYVYPDDEKYYLPAGIISFSLGHFFYTYAFIKNGDLFAFVPIGIMFIMFFFTLIITTISEQRLDLDMGKYRPLIILYSCIISLPLTASLLAFIFNPCDASALRFGGILLFFISDLILSLIYFKKGLKTKTLNVLITANHCFYYVGQILIASSLMF